MSRKHRVVTVFLALAMVLALTVPAWAGVGGETGGSQRVKINTIVRENYTDTRSDKTVTLTAGETELAPALFALITEETADAWKDGQSHDGTVTFEGGKSFAVTYRATGEDKELPAGGTEFTMIALFVTVKDYSTIPGGQYYTEYVENKAEMTTTYTGSELLYDGAKYDPDTGNIVELNEIRDDYYTRNHVYYRLAISKAVRSSGSSAPYITAVLNGSSARSATDYSGGIYGLIFRASAAYSGFTGVQVDGKTIDKGCYTAEDNGGTEVYLKAVYLQTLAAGKHTLTVLTSAGDMTAEFTVGGVVTAPKTFDAGIALYAGMAALSAGGAVLWKKKD